MSAGASALHFPSEIKREFRQTWLWPAATLNTQQAASLRNLDHADPLPVVSVARGLDQSNASVLRRLDRIEVALGISPGPSSQRQSVSSPDDGPENIALGPLQAAVSCLKARVAPNSGLQEWEPAVVKHLWQS